MERVFVVLRSRGPAWDDSKPLESQAAWAAHAEFMDALFEERLLRLSARWKARGTRCSFSARQELPKLSSASQRIVDGHGLLVTRQISPWQLRLGTVG